MLADNPSAFRADIYANMRGGAYTGYDFDSIFNTNASKLARLTGLPPFGRIQYSSNLIDGSKFTCDFGHVLYGYMASSGGPPSLI